MLLQPDQRTKLDDTDDIQFYGYPRFVTHVDAGFIRQLTDLYRQHLQPGFTILDLMSSWVSHLPEEIEFAKVVGHGLNAEELAKNPRLDDFYVQNLNQNLQLPHDDRTFDAVVIAVSVQYLQYPEAIFSEIHRVLKPNGVVIVSFSNRMFYQKAIQAWRERTDHQRLQLVQSYFSAVKGMGPPQLIANDPPQSSLLSWMGLGGGDPFFAVVKQRLSSSAQECSMNGVSGQSV
ncbi:methyltransferase domain-containing protein [Acaryochloris sp. IP29b_bin.137]|uniref:class I SAM-dependent methyltransferase n=1 Tax=Acaryochloris sp. IP29b_bin.137 TaxID=2969217 RepID=UPI00262F6FA4|nr:methyltransferase domain-containing protein [Acaryochloris sp. IP29b_bin.137]